MEFWCRFDELEPISSEWLHTGTTAAAAVNGAAVFAATQGCEIKQRTAESFQPRYVPAAKQAGRMSEDEIRREMRRSLGT